VGCRTKLGHQVTLKLLRAGTKVIGTTRYSESARKMFENYEDCKEWRERLDIYEDLDLDVKNMKEVFEKLREYISMKYGVLDIFIFCAAQTIRVREKQKEQVSESLQETNRYGDAKFVNETFINSWQMKLEDLEQSEIEEVTRINAIAPCLLSQVLVPMMQESKFTPYIIFVHAREGLFQCKKSPKHIHTNLAKAALAMLTKSLVSSKFKTKSGNKFSVHGCDPGWISVDEYYQDDRPWIVPPLDEIDGAARILYPIFRKLKSSAMTRRHFQQLKY